jgi:hypothetical protein
MTMSDDLRTRIAECASNFLSDQFYAYLEHDQALELADAVIEALGLREEREDVASFQSTGEMDDSVIPPRPKSRLIWTPSHRYITEWTADE